MGAPNDGEDSRVTPLVNPATDKKMLKNSMVLMTMDAHRTKDEDDDGWTDDAGVRASTIWYPRYGTLFLLSWWVIYLIS